VIRWWDEPELTLFAHTGDIGLAEQFAAWCQHATETLGAITGVDMAAVDDGLARFLREGES